MVKNDAGDSPSWSLEVEVELPWQRLQRLWGVRRKVGETGFPFLPPPSFLPFPMEEGGGKRFK